MESVGSKVSTLVGILLIVGAGLTDGGKLGGKVNDGVYDGAPVGMFDASIPDVGKTVGIGDTVGSGETVGKTDVVGCADIVGWTETVGSSVSGGSVSDGESVTIGLELGKMDSMACNGLADGASVSTTAGGHGNTLGKPLGEGCGRGFLPSKLSGTCSRRSIPNIF